MVGGFLKNLFGGGSFEEIQSGIADLDNAYDFRSDNPDAARPLIVGRMAQALRWLGETWPSGQALVALRGSDAFLLLPMEKNYFELPGISTPVSYDEHVKPMIADLVTLLETAALVRQVGESEKQDGGQIDLCCVLLATQAEPAERLVAVRYLLRMNGRIVISRASNV